jgi:hypothetical protein
VGRGKRGTHLATIAPDPIVVYDPAVGAVPDEGLNLEDIPAIEDFSTAMSLQGFVRKQCAFRQENEMEQRLPRVLSASLALRGWNPEGVIVQHPALPCHPIRAALCSKTTQSLSQNMP